MVVDGPVASAAETAGVGVARAIDAVDTASAGFEIDHSADIVAADTLAAGTVVAQFARGEIADDMPARAATA